MSAEREVIREFLAVLGFQVNEPSLKRFLGALTDTCKLASKAGAGIVGVAAAAEAFTTGFARNMEKMYYSTQRTGAAVKNMSAMEFGFSQVGLSVDEARESIESFTATTRTMPGMQALLRNLGVDTAADPTKQFKSMIRQLQKLPYYIAVQYAEMFGVPERMFKTLSASGALDRLEDAERRQQNWYKQMGVDQEKAAAAGREYMNVLRDIWTQIDIVGDKIAIDLLPHFHEFHGVVSELLQDLAQVDYANIDLSYLGGFIEEQTEKWGKWGKAVKIVVDGIKFVGSIKDASDNSLGRLFFWMSGSGATGPQFDGPEFATPRDLSDKGAAEADRNSRNKYGLIQRPKPKAPPISGNTLFSSLEQWYGLPSGILDSVWAAESGRGKYMVSPKGARGHFGFMPNTQKEYGLENPDDLNESATAASRKLANLLKYYKGDIEKAIAAYNWGEGNLDRNGLGAAPAETRDYLNKILGAERAGPSAPGPVSLVNDVDINVYGSDSRATADAVAMAQGRVWGDVVRNFVPRVV